MTDARSAALAGLLAEDQAEDRDVLAGQPAYVALRARDRTRREAVMALLADGWPEDADALYAAAWVLNHGDLSEEAALDRSLMYSGRPQKYGTNIVPDGVGWRLWEVDPATTDEERLANDVPPLAAMEARAAAMTDPQPDMAEAPVWLKGALRRRADRSEG